MRAVVITKHGGPGVLQVQERPDPVLAAGEVRIDVAAANGTVTPYVAGTADQIVGRCTQPGGVVTATNAVGRMRVSL